MEILNHIIVIILILIAPYGIGVLINGSYQEPLIRTYVTGLKVILLFVVAISLLFITMNAIVQIILKYGG